MNRRSFIARCVSAMATVVFPWRSAPAEELTVAKAALESTVNYYKLASKFQWECSYVPSKSAYLIQCWGKFQDGLEYGCAEYVDFESEYVDGDEYTEGKRYDADPEVVLQEMTTTFNQALRRRFDKIEKHEGNFIACRLRALNGHIKDSGIGFLGYDRTESS